MAVGPRQAVHVLLTISHPPPRDVFRIGDRLAHNPRRRIERTRDQHLGIARQLERGAVGGSSRCGHGVLSPDVWWRFKSAITHRAA